MREREGGRERERERERVRVQSLGVLMRCLLGINVSDTPSISVKFSFLYTCANVRGYVEKELACVREEKNDKKTKKRKIEKEIKKKKKKRNKKKRRESFFPFPQTFSMASRRGAFSEKIIVCMAEFIDFELTSKTKVFFFCGSALFGMDSAYEKDAKKTHLIQTQYPSFSPHFLND